MELWTATCSKTPWWRWQRAAESGRRSPAISRRRGWSRRIGPFCMQEPRSALLPILVELLQEPLKLGTRDAVRPAGQAQRLELAESYPSNDCSAIHVQTRRDIADGQQLLRHSTGAYFSAA